MLKIYLWWCQISLHNLSLCCINVYYPTNTVYNNVQSSQLNFIYIAKSQLWLASGFYNLYSSIQHPQSGLGNTPPHCVWFWLCVVCTLFLCLCVTYSVFCVNVWLSESSSSWCPSISDLSNLIFLCGALITAYQKQTYPCCTILLQGPKYVPPQSRHDC